MYFDICCPDCSSTKLLIPPRPRRDEYVTCSVCGARSKFGSLEDESTRRVRAMLAEDFPELLFR